MYGVLDSGLYLLYSQHKVILDGVRHLLRSYAVERYNLTTGTDFLVRCFIHVEGGMLSKIFFVRCSNERIRSLGEL